MADQMRSLLRNTGVRIVTILLLLQAAAYYGFSKTEYVPDSEPLATFPIAISGWMMVQDSPVEKDVLDVLKADDTLNRTYERSAGLPVNLFVAAFRTQRTGKAPHSPKNCLPGSGWAPSVNDQVLLNLPGEGPREVNRYIVTKGEAKSVVLYWYQSRDRVIASELKAKVFGVADSIRYNRSDTALVRVIAPVPPGREEIANREVVDFATAAFPALRQILPR